MLRDSGFVVRAAHSYDGLMLVMVPPFCGFLHSLSMNKPVGCVYLVPLGAFNSSVRSDMVLARR